jgi:hypothetical protein
MRRKTMSKSLLVAGFLVMAGAFAPQAMSAGVMPQSTISGVEADTMVQKAQYGGGYCRNWRHKCADLWGWRSRNFYICMRRVGCN